MKVAIVGAGVAGLASAGLLAQQGHQVDLFERAGGIRSIGAGVLLFPSASEVLRQLGVLTKVQSLAGMPSRLQRLSPAGKNITELDFSKLNQDTSTPTLAILRRDLMTCLESACQVVGLHFNCLVDQVHLNRLQNEYDVVLGCDGRMRSVCRERIAPEEGPVDSGIVNVIGISHVNVPSIDSVFDYWQPNKRFGIVPVSPYQAYWAAAWCDDNSHCEEVTIQSLRRRFADWPVQSILTGVVPNSLRTIKVHDLNRIEHWTDGNLLLLGDAAHAPLPTSGQGACLALEDAGLFTSLLAQSTSVPGVLADYVSQRQPRTDSVQRLGREIASQLFPAAKTTKSEK